MMDGYFKEKAVRATFSKTVMLGEAITTTPSSTRGLPLLPKSPLEDRENPQNSGQGQKRDDCSVGSSRNACADSTIFLVLR